LKLNFKQDKRLPLIGFDQIYVFLNNKLN